MTEHTPNHPIEAKHSEKMQKKSYLSLFAFILSLLSLGLLIDYVFVNSEKMNVLNLKISDISQIKTTSVDQIQQNINTLNQENAQKIQDLTAKIQSIKQPQSNLAENDSKWTLLKAKYYLELAEINQHWAAQDPETIISLLKAADNLLTSQNEQPILEIRQAIAADIQEVQNTHYPDLPALLSQLNALETALDVLPFQKITPFSDNTKTNTIEKSTGSWRDRLKNSMHFLEKFVVIRHNSGKGDIPLTPVNQTFLKQNIRWNLQKAEWALLQFQPKIFLSALDQTQINIQKIFDTQAPSTEAFSKQLNLLKKTEFPVKNDKGLSALPLLTSYLSKEESSTPIIPKEESNTPIVPEEGATP